MDWFLYDNSLRHERINFEIYSEVRIRRVIGIVGGCTESPNLKISVLKKSKFFI